MPKADVQATAAANFRDERSFIWKDGREQLYGEDWESRKWELHIRSEGRCENMIAGQRCTRVGDDPHHLTLRSVSRDDRMANLLNACRTCHYVLDAAQRKEHHKR